MAEPSLLQSTLFAEHGITAIFTRRGGGCSPAPYNSLNFGRDSGDSDHNVDQNLALLQRHSRLASLPHQAVQVHGTSSLVCSGTAQMHQAEADILFTAQPGSAVAVRTADCLPILLADPCRGVVAAVHAGWRGTAAAVARIAVEEMFSMGASAEHIIAASGPCIGRCCFTIGKETADALADSCDHAHEKIFRRNSSLYADLRAINHLQLLQAGIKPSHIESVDGCTQCDCDHYFSYRRDGIKSGRHLAIVAMPVRP